MRTQLSALLALLIIVPAFSFAQDIIMKKNNELIKCKIREIGLDEIKYNLPEYSSDVLFSIDKDKITKIIFENGKEMEFQKEMTNPANYADNRKNVLKIDFLSPLTGNTTFAYERSLRPGRSIEATLGIIGLGADADDRNAGGAFVKFGYKFLRDPDFYVRGMKYSHILKGSYIKPEVAMALFSYDSWEYYNYFSSYASEKIRENVFSGSVQLVFGKQWVIDNAFAIDYFVGVGYGFSTDNNNYEVYHYGYTVSDNAFPIAFSTGLKIGYLFK